MIVFVSDLHIGDRSTGVQHLEVAAFLEALPNIARQADGNDAQEVIFVFLGDVFDMIRSDFWKDSASQPWQLPTPGPSFEADLGTLMGRIQCNWQMDNRLSNNEAIFDLWSQPLVGRHFQWKTGELLPAPLTAEEREAQAADTDNRPVWPYKLEPRRQYIPGNHDRPINQFQSLREMAIQALGLDIRDPTDTTPPVDSSAPFPYFVLQPEYGVFARHGQEWDSANFEHVSQWKDLNYEPSLQDFLDVPLGDLIAIEYSLLAGRVRDKLAAKYPEIAKTEREDIVEQLKVIDDVRPQAAVLPWIFDSLTTNIALATRREELIDVLFDELSASGKILSELPYVQDWISRHNKLGRPDEADLAWLALNALQRLHEISDIAGIFRWRLYSFLDWLSHRLSGQTEITGNSNYEQEALADLRRVMLREDWKQRQDGQDWTGIEKTLYILYGHTHKADQVPLTVPRLSDTPTTATAPVAIVAAAVEAAANQQPCAVYLNTGTWRPLQRQTIAQDGFMRWKKMTYTLFYSAGKDLDSEAQKSKSQLPTFETWTGNLLSPLREPKTPPV